MSLLRVEGLKVSFRSGGQVVEAVRGVDFSIERGETLALVGESGSGKSVTAMSVLQLLPYPTAFHPGGSVRFDGEELMGAKPAALRALRGGRVGTVFQEPMTSLNPLHTLEKQLVETLTLHQRLDPRAARDRALELLELVHLPDAGQRLKSYPHQLSGGQRQRVMIAMALANDPDLLVADEPTTALDVTIQAQILRLIRELQQKLNMAVLLITHDLTIVRHTADRVAVMTGGEIVESGPAERIFRAPEHPYTRRLLDAEPKGAAAAVEEGAETVMRARGLKVWFPIKRGVLRRTVGHVKAVDGLDIEVRRGQTVGVVGESGSGKTTLGMALLRLISSEGEILFEGGRIDGLSSKETRPLRRQMQIVFQDPYSSLSPRLSVFQIIEEGLLVHGLGGDYAARRQRVAEALHETGLDPAVMDRFPHEFSGGQRQRVAVARAMVLNPRFVVLDEPTSALDMTVQAQITDLLRDLQRRHGLGYLFISHDLRVVRALADELVVMKDGVAVEQGPAAGIFAEPKTEYTRALMAAAFDIAVVDGDGDAEKEN